MELRYSRQVHDQHKPAGNLADNSLTTEPTLQVSKLISIYTATSLILQIQEVKPLQEMHPNGAFL